MTHPGLTEPGVPGSERYLCPLCDWYLDVPPFDPETASQPHTAVASLDELVRAIVVERAAEVEAAIAEHLREAHTAPIVLACS